MTDASGDTHTLTKEVFHNMAMIILFTACFLLFIVVIRNYLAAQAALPEHLQEDIIAQRIQTCFEEQGVISQAKLQAGTLYSCLGDEAFGAVGVRFLPHRAGEQKEILLPGEYSSKSSERYLVVIQEEKKNLYWMEVLFR